jgi:hypothetical protein
MGERALMEREQDGEVVEARCSVGMLRAERLLEDGQRAPFNQNPYRRIRSHPLANFDSRSTDWPHLS